MTRNHILFAILAVVTFVAHLVANLFVDQMYWLPEYVWAASTTFAVLSVYAGAAEACKLESRERGLAIASAVIGALVLLGLMYSGITWLFMGGDMPGVEM